MILYLELLGVGPVKKNTLYIYICVESVFNRYQTWQSATLGLMSAIGTLLLFFKTCKEIASLKIEKTSNKKFASLRIGKHCIVKKTGIAHPYKNRGQMQFLNTKYFFPY